MLIEVMVGAVILSIATAAVLDGLDGAQKTGRMNKDRSVAATLAQQDVERLRALPIPALVGLEQTRAVDVNGVRYTVGSKTTWLRDNSSELSCTDDTSQAAYLKVVSTASSPAGADRPVTETTLITPPTAFSSTTGTAAVRTTDREGNPLSGVAINLTSSAGSYSGTTNQLGCAIFTFIKPGIYTAQSPGQMVSWNSIRPANTDLTVVAGKTTPATMEMEQPASIRISFKTPSGTAVPWNAATVPHPKLGGFRKKFTSPTKATSLVAADLFPQKDGYGAYAGDCEANNPASWDDPDYFVNHPLSHAKVDPGSFEVPLTAVMPTLNLTVKRQNNQSVYLQFSQIDQTDDDDCRKNIHTRLPKWINGGSGMSTAQSTSVWSLPFGNYVVCVDDNSRHASTTVALTSPTFVDRTLDLRSGTAKGMCPNPVPTS